MTEIQVGAIEYASKDTKYFSGIRADFVAELPKNPEARILEVGCGAGNTGALALAERKCGWYSAVELDEKSAGLAKEWLNEVIVGNVESIDFSWPERSFDVLIMSEVLEHFVDPWLVLRKLRPLLKPGALFFCSSPNVSHYKVIRMLIQGEWRLEDSGVMDRTHLRWFTPKTYAALVESAGFVIDYVGPIKPFSWWDRVRSLLTGGRSHLFIKQIKIRAHCPE